MVFAATALLALRHCAVIAAGQVVVTHLRADAVDVREVDWTRPTAIVLGNERAGDSCPAVMQAGRLPGADAGVCCLHQLCVPVLLD